MSSNNDNAMTRFLFAILKQKCLKDIDWNKVAHDPILTQEITNGHAARMRYSRFRSAMLGLEPQRRNRKGEAKNRVAKPKKDTKGKKEDVVKPEPAGDENGASPSSPSSIKQDAACPASPRVKQEALQHAPMAIDGPDPRHPPISVPSLLDSPHHHHHHHARLLTPCSDSDMLAASQGFAAATPASDMVHSDAFSPAVDFPSPCGGGGGHEAPPTHHEPWHHPAPPAGYTSAFDAAYDMGAYGVGLCEHQHHQHQHQHQHVHPHAHPGDLLGLTADPGQVSVKHEWDGHYH